MKRIGLFLVLTLFIILGGVSLESCGPSDPPRDITISITNVPAMYIFSNSFVLSWQIECIGVFGARVSFLTNDNLLSNYIYDIYFNTNTKLSFVSNTTFILPDGVYKFTGQAHGYFDDQRNENGVFNNTYYYIGVNTEIEPNDGGASLNRVQAFTAIKGELVSNDLDEFMIWLTAGNSYTITITPSAGLDPNLNLYFTSGGSIWADGDSDSGPGVAEQIISYNCTNSKYYYITTYNVNGVEGTYVLDISQD